MNYKILFIDEERAQQDIFMDYFESVCPEIVPECELPLSTIEEMLQKIEALCPDAIVTDFQLNDIRVDVSYAVKYNGIELIRAIRARWEDFPCFVVTSYDDDAVNSSDDVNLVYIKDILNSRYDKAKVTFAERIIRQVDKYRSKIGEAKQKLAELIDKRNSGVANVYDESHIIELDTFLEKSLGAHDAIPRELKELSNLKRLNELIGKVDELLNRI